MVLRKIPGREYWEDIWESDNYKVSTFGRIYNGNTREFLSTERDSKGYIVVEFEYNGERFKKGVHRLVMETFTDYIPQLKLIVNHIDENKSNNYLDNLEWVDYQENRLYSIDRRKGISRRGIMY